MDEDILESWYNFINSFYFNRIFFFKKIFHLVFILIGFIYNNMNIMNQAGVTIYIEAEPEELACRLLASKTVRPLIVGKSKEELIPFITKHLSQRECYYKSAQIIYHTDKMITKDEIHLTVEGIVERLKNII